MPFITLTKYDGFSKVAINIDEIKRIETYGIIHSRVYVSSIAGLEEIRCWESFEEIMQDIERIKNS